MAPRPTIQGFTLLEVLVAMTILGVVLLGSSLVMLAGLRASAAASHHALASALAQDLLERMRSNRGAAALYALEFDAAPADPGDASCATSVPCGASARATTDLAEWRESLQSLAPGASARVVPSFGADDAWDGVEVELRWLEPGAPHTQSFRLVVVDDD